MSTTPRLLDPDEITRQLRDLPDWRVEDTSLVAVFKGSDFVASVSLVDDIAVDAEAMNHHPDLDIRWNRVTVRLSTHSAGGLTQFDIELAHQISQAAAARGSVAVPA